MKERYLVTGCAGFIASKVVDLLLASGHTVVGLDNLNDAYDPRLKRWRLERLQRMRNFTFHRADISDAAAIEPLLAADAPPAAASPPAMADSTTMPSTAVSGIPPGRSRKEPRS